MSIVTKISSEAELEQYRAEIHAKIQENNPNREFCVLLGGNNWPDKIESVVVWLDGKGELTC